MGNQLLVVRVMSNGGETARFGFVAGKVVGGAVVRNRVKRRLRAAAASLQARPGIDIVISARKPAAGAPFERLAASLASLLGRAGALDAPAGRTPGSTQESP